MVSYERLWETMKKKNISQYYLIHYCNVSSSQIDRLKKNCYVSTHTIEKLCFLLQCNVEDSVKESRGQPKNGALKQAIEK